MPPLSASGCTTPRHRGCNEPRARAQAGVRPSPATEALVRELENLQSLQQQQDVAELEARSEARRTRRLRHIQQLQKEEEGGCGKKAALSPQQQQQQQALAQGDATAADDKFDERYLRPQEEAAQKPSKPSRPSRCKSAPQILSLQMSLPTDAEASQAVTLGGSSQQQRCHRRGSSLVTAETVEVGLRVRRGRDWQPEYRDQDGGFGMQGTVTEVLAKYDNTVCWVKWDSGRHEPYSIGYERRHELAHVAQGETRWRYQPSDGRCIDVRSKPSVASSRTGYALRPGDVFSVRETLRGPDHVTYLRLADYRGGWLFDRKPGVGVMCVQIPEEPLQADAACLSSWDLYSKRPQGLSDCGEDAYWRCGTVTSTTATALPSTSTSPSMPSTGDYLDSCFSVEGLEAADAVAPDDAEAACAGGWPFFMPPMPAATSGDGEEVDNNQWYSLGDPVADAEAAEIFKEDLDDWMGHFPQPWFQGSDGDLRCSCPRAAPSGSSTPRARRHISSATGLRSRGLRQGGARPKADRSWQAGFSAVQEGVPVKEVSAPSGIHRTQQAVRSVRTGEFQSNEPVGTEKKSTFRRLGSVFGLRL
eukprot:TRINITY_DN21920_c0_g3_i1.p1 TRINITY_DN21920_c0_g3~~TRINITY_DN21920_c0_g3_i1.p1  ORF type:complete len:588 (-),score=124.41 TRINITY_DN21920_c0_g3_i1:31-1794(-)